MSPETLPSRRRIPWAMPMALPVVLALLALLAAAPRALADPPPDATIGGAPDQPFCPGERLRFALSWEHVPAGKASLEVMPPTIVEGRPALHFRMTANTNSFLDVFYQVRDQVDSYTAPDLSRTLLYTKRQREGSYKRDIEVRFFWDRSRARYSNKINGPKEPIFILPGTLDPLSIFFGFRATDIAIGRTYTAPVTDGVKCVIGAARVIGRETVQVPAGTFDAFVVEPELQHIGGVFRKSRDASIRVWITADARHMPVKVSSRVAVGRFFAELTGFEAPGCGSGSPAASLP